MRTGPHTRLLQRGLLAALLAGVPATARADLSVTPTLATSARATDNAGDRPAGMGPQQDAIGDAAAGLQVVASTPLSLIKLEALGEYERYLSESVRNLYASGGLDGRWRPDERTNLRALLKASYAPDRYDPRVPYRLALTAPDGSELPAFVQATTTHAEADFTGEHWLTEVLRGRAELDLSSTRYSDRGTIGGVTLTPWMLPSRTVGALTGEALRQVSEPASVGAFMSWQHGEYEVGPPIDEAATGVDFEYAVTERFSLKAKAGPDFLLVPRSSLPPRGGFLGEISATRKWETAQWSATARTGSFVTRDALPASNRNELRMDGAWDPAERLELSAFLDGAREESQYAQFMPTGIYEWFSAGGAASWRLSPRWAFKLGGQHDELVSDGAVAFPFRANVIWVGLTFTGPTFGDPPVQP